MHCLSKESDILQAIEKFGPDKAFTEEHRAHRDNAKNPATAIASPPCPFL